MNKKNKVIKRSKAFREIADWWGKVAFLKKQIEYLDKLKNAPSLAFASFLLKAQLIEFELKQLFSGLDLHLAFNNHSKILKRKIKRPIDVNKWTLGKLKDEIKKYKGEFLNDLVVDLENFHSVRNKLIHHLFDPGNIEDLVKEAKRGLISANKTIKELERVNEFLKRNDPIKKLKRYSEK